MKFIRQSRKNRIFRVGLNLEGALEFIILPELMAVLGELKKGLVIGGR